MAQVLVRDIPDDHALSLKADAVEAGVSVEALMRQVIAKRHQQRRKAAALERAVEITEVARRWREASGLPPEAFPDSVELLRESRTDDDPTWT